MMRRASEAPGGSDADAVTATTVDDGQPWLTELAARVEETPIDQPLVRLAALAALSVAVDAERLTCVGAAREERLSWSSIGAVLGISKQAAQHRFTRPDGDPVGEGNQRRSRPVSPRREALDLELRVRGVTLLRIVRVPSGKK